jgi:hypothetical protein
LRLHAENTDIDIVIQNIVLWIPKIHFFVISEYR